MSTITQRMTTRIAMIIPMTEKSSASESITSSLGSVTALYRLLTFLSPAFPVGAFTYSHGLEQAIEDDDVTSAEELQQWLEAVITQGSGHNDAILLVQTMQAADKGDEADVRELIDLGLALQPSRERHLETSAQGTAFIRTVLNAWRPEAMTSSGHLFHTLTHPENAEIPDLWPYPVAVGLTAAAWELPAAETVTAFLQAFTSNIVSAAIRAIPLGQSEGQRVLAALEPAVHTTAAKALTAGLDALGSSIFLADIASMAHETKYSRIFRS